MVDDNPANLVALEAVLEPLGVPLLRASSGQEALRRALDSDFALILMDAQMPGMDGFQTAALIKQREKTMDVPLIFMSAVYRDIAYPTKGYSIGAVDYIVKPFEPELLRAKVQAIISERQRRDRLKVQAQQLLVEQQKRLAEQAARQAAEATNRLKDEFIAKLSHELRSPMQVIVGWATLLRAAKVPATETEKAIQAIYRNALLQTRLVEDLFDMARMRSGKLSVVRMETNVDEVVGIAVQGMTEIAASREVLIESSLEPCVAQCDAERLHQIVANLLANAVKFSHRGGRVEVRLSATSAEFELRVADHGVGIPRSALAHVFDAFWQGPAGSSPTTPGLGLGLAIVRQLVELQGGHITVESPGPGLGATFIVRMPRWTTDMTWHERQQAEIWARQETRLDGVRILVLDDEADARELLAVLLGELGGQVTVAESVTSAMAVLDHDRQDLVVSDLSMPDEDGFASVRRVRAHELGRVAKVPAVAVSAHGGELGRPRALQAGFDAFVGKPFLPGELVAVIGQLLSRTG